MQVRAIYPECCISRFHAFFLKGQDARIPNNSPGMDGSWSQPSNCQRRSPTCPRRSFRAPLSPTAGLDAEPSSQLAAPMLLCHARSHFQQPYDGDVRGNGPYELFNLRATHMEPLVRRSMTYTNIPTHRHRFRRRTTSYRCSSGSLKELIYALE